ncbi:hypothetical protein PILCRDRAFT_535904 [Piloderma croceum F 1598]|uniref:Protein NO VEIN C-terminal domain-containing protein n=1 Tax=Piloderma croceum (strain F 1598) TaxID=765440 RepID=A0A0C3FKW5_PILCF|nr:hypothetical protein PILCRDRAFT_535904 [Piloderma croceum F 1598]
MTTIPSTNMSYADIDNQLSYYLSSIKSKASPHFRVVTSDTFNGGPLRSSLGSQLGTSSTSDFRDVSWDSALGMDPTVYAARESVRGVPAVRGTPDASSTGVGGGYSIFRSQASPSQLINGILGEFFVYSILSEQLPEFGPENWTSEFRGRFPGLEPYEELSLADFIYSDCQGVLSIKLFDKETIATWKGEWPNYHIEVKSTSGRDGERFHMSRLQVQHAFNMTTHQSISPPKELYIIFRVSNILSSPTLTVYLDPHWLFYSGDLRIVSDVEVEISGNS